MQTEAVNLLHANEAWQVFRGKAGGQLQEGTTPHREVDNLMAGRLVIIEAHNAILVPVAAIRYQRRTDRSSLDQPPGPQLVHLLQNSRQLMPQHHRCRALSGMCQEPPQPLGPCQETSSCWCS